MRRDEIIDLLETLKKDIDSNQVSEQIQMFFRPDREKKSIDFKILKSLFASWDAMTESQKELATKLGISDIYKPEFWQIISASDGAREDFIELFKTTSWLSVSANGIISALQWSEVESADSRHSSITKENLIKLVIPDGGHDVLSAAALAKLLTSLQGVYEIALAVAGQPADQLKIVALDSGSDKVLMFEGLGDGIRALGEFIFEIWDRIAIGGLGKRHAQLNMIGKSLDLVQKVTDLENGGSIGPEQAEIYRRTLLSSTETIATVGAITAIQEGQRLPHVRALTLESRRLLAPPEETRATAVEVTHSESVAENGQGRMEVLLKRIEELEKQSATKPRRKPRPETDEGQKSGDTVPISPP